MSMRPWNLFLRLPRPRMPTLVFMGIDVGLKRASKYGTTFSLNAVMTPKAPRDTTAPENSSFSESTVSRGRSYTSKLPFAVTSCQTNHSKSVHLMHHFYIALVTSSNDHCTPFAMPDQRLQISHRALATSELFCKEPLIRSSLHNVSHIFYDEERR